MSKISNAEQVAIIDKFVADLEASLGVQREKVSFEEVWNSSPPPEAQGLSFEDYMHNASWDAFFHDDFHSLSQLREEYELKYSKEPYVSPPVKWQW